MSCLHYIDNQLCIERVSLRAIAERFGTPTYIYSKQQLVNNWQAFHQAFKNIPHTICYAVKANSNIALLQILADLKSGFDIVSIGELTRVQVAGGLPNKTIFSGVGKSAKEIAAALTAGIACFNVESYAELLRINHIAEQLQKPAPVAIRVNPDIDARTHPYIATGLKINKFGIAMQDVLDVCLRIKQLPYLNLIGIACHIGSQITNLGPVLAACDQMTALYNRLQEHQIPIQQVDMGGGLGIIYNTENPPSISDYAKAIVDKFKPFPVELMIEPGRAIIGDAGVLLTRVEYIKETPSKNFAIVDAGMNDLLRPALYEAYQPILAVEHRTEIAQSYDIVGPVCESADFMGKDRLLSLKAQDLLVVDKVGAYGFCMSSNYNSRLRPAEILVDGSHFHVIRQRETMTDMIALEQLVSQETEKI
ncbi:MAG: diaminopimelate decarboxylase [Gammaproteobacteria bacterium]|nr:diaminopimelate decarboxylase [Gammaproteobacteria bacterium]